MTTKQATLSDLYRRGKNVTITDPGTGVEVEFYLKKLNPLEAKQARDKGNASRARVLMKRKDPESDVYLAAYSEAYDQPRESRIDDILGMKVLQKRQQVEAEVEMTEDSEWAKDGYLSGLRESWDDELRDQFVDPEIENEDKEDAVRVFGELQRFGDEVEKVLKHEIAALRRPYEAMSDDELLEKTIETQFEQMGFAAWLDTYHSYRVLLSVRDKDDHSKKVFKHLTEVQELETPVFNTLIDEYSQLEATDMQVKDLEQTPSS